MTTQTLRFLMGGEVRELRDFDPTMTVLQYLRDSAGRCGTKEGCAEGDCGACSVVVAEATAGNSLRYRAVNACIQFLPTLHGKQLITVEDLKDRAATPESPEKLHPAQQAMVDCHGSQCGFCTPGFVMSLFAMFHEEKAGAWERTEINDALAGNLCRCTGYGPIVRAAQSMRDYGTEDHFDAQAAETLATLQGLADGKTLALSYQGRHYFAPTTIDELVELLSAYPDACLLAGGTDVGLWVTKQHQVLETVIYTGDVAELHEIRETSEAIEIGAAATYSEAHEILAAEYPDAGELIRRLGSLQIRNSGTLGGNIANGSPIGDSMPFLLAAGASLVLRSGSERRSLPLERFFRAYRETDLKPGEFLERVIVPRSNLATKLRCYKISKRFDQDISAVCAAFALELEGDNVKAFRSGLGGMAAIPKRAEACEAALVGKPWTRETIDAAMAALDSDFAPMSDMRASSDYRRVVARNLLLKFFLETTEAAGETRLVGDKELAHA